VGDWFHDGDFDRVSVVQNKQVNKAIDVVFDIRVIEKTTNPND